ncbi:MAG: hypothetical protein Q8O04_11970 [Deltaproteobacteria bacterium]|nr:hypothetical protein [Deltaproteobacteria bacterium]
MSARGKGLELDFDKDIKAIPIPGLIVLDIPEPFPYDLGQGSGCAMHKGQAEGVDNLKEADVSLNAVPPTDAALRPFLFYHYRFTLHATSSLAFLCSVKEDSRGGRYYPGYSL